MLPSEVVGGAIAPPTDPGPRGLVHWLGTSNPFYVVSAGLFLLGVRVSFGDPDDDIDTFALMIGLGGYTLLLAVTGWLLVRFLKVWDDARTVLLLVVLMLLTTSIMFDELLAFDPVRGIACFVIGLLFAVAVSEGLLQSLRLRMPVGFRVPYYLFLGLFFLYPLGLQPYIAQPQSETLMWGFFGFSPMAGLITLSLVPAARRGRDYVRDNGSPWPWPLFPWSLFVFLGAAVVGRSYFLCHSLHLLQGMDYTRTIFGLYFLVPFGLAVAVVLLEIGMNARHRATMFAALAMPAGLITLACVGHQSSGIYQTFLRHFTEAFGGSPFRVALAGSVGFYLYAVVRRVPFATEALTASLATMAVVDPAGRWVREPGPWSVSPAAVAVLMQLTLGLWRKNAWRCLFGTGGLIALVMLAVPVSVDGVSVRAPLAFHLAVICVLAVGAAFNDAVGRYLRSIGSAAVFAASLAVIAVWPYPPAGLPRELLVAYPLVMAVGVGLYGWRFRDPSTLVVAAAIPMLWLIAVGIWGYTLLRRIVVGLDYIALSLAAFGVAGLISWVKSRGRPREGIAVVPDETLLL